MRSARSVALVLIAAILAACGGSASPSPSPSPVDPGGFVLRATNTQALPPDATFGWLPMLLITSDGRLISVGPTDAMVPGKLLPNLLERQISQAGWLAIVNAARKAGLLSGGTDFTGNAAAPGALLAHLELVVDGRRFDLTGDLTIPPCAPPGCPPPEPGTQRAFAEFWQTLGDLSSWIGPELGNERPYTASAYALLVGPPADTQGLLTNAVTWPLARKLADFGRPIAADDARRCGVVDGLDATTLRPLLQAATAISPWFDDGAPNTGFGLVVRPLLPGDANPCAAL